MHRRRRQIERRFLLSGHEDSFIDRAILNGQTVVYLIHGNGTGALRTAIHKHLRGNRMVKSFRLGRYGEGESGVTVVELK